MELTEERLAMIEARAAAVPHQRLISLARKDVPALVAEVRRLRAEIAELEAKIQSDEDSAWERSEYK